MIGDSNYVDLSVPVNSVSSSYVVHPECSIVGESCQPGVCWIPSICKLFCFVIVILNDMFSLFYFILLFLDVVFDRFELDVIFDMITDYIRLLDDFRCFVSKYYYGNLAVAKFRMSSIQWI